MAKRVIKIIVFLSFLILFISIINKFLHIKIWDYDFWWHLASGRYIVEHKTLPDKDPFSFVSNLEENKTINPSRLRVLLKSYWLSQIIFYKIYDNFKEKGIILFRSFILFGIIFSIFLWFKRQNVSFFIIYPFIFFVFMGTLSFTGERPVLFTLLFSVIIFMVLDNFKQKKNNSIFSLIPLMLVWANLHGGFILGDVIILTYIFGESIKYFFLKKDELDKNTLKKLCIVGFIAILTSAINPVGFTPFLTITKSNKIFQKAVHEYLSPFTHYLNGYRPIDIEYISLIVLFPILLIVRNKKIDITNYLLLAGLLYMSITALRFMIYYICFGSMILGRDLYYALEEYKGKFKINKLGVELIASFLILASSILYMAGFLDFNKIAFAKSYITVPEGAVKFIRTNNIEGNIFNEMGIGGYLIWRLYPWKKIFIDTRQTNYIVTNEYTWICSSIKSIQNIVLPKGKKPLWERLLDHYKIDIIVIDVVGPLGRTKPIIFSLLKSDKWEPVYCDFFSFIFVRNKKENNDIIRKYKLSQDEVYDILLIKLTQLIMTNRRNPQYLISIGDVFFDMKNYNDALKAYTFADRKHSTKETKLKIELTKLEIEKERLSEKGEIL